MIHVVVFAVFVVDVAVDCVADAAAAGDVAKVVARPDQVSMDSSHMPRADHLLWQCRVEAVAVALHCALWAHNEEAVAVVVVVAVGVMLLVRLVRFAASAAIFARFSHVRADCDCPSVPDVQAVQRPEY